MDAQRANLAGLKMIFRGRMLGRLALAGCLITSLAACETLGQGARDSGAATTATLPASDGLSGAPQEPGIAQASMPQPSDDLGLGKWHFRAGNFGLAEQHFRRVVEANAASAEGWVGLAAAYDQLRRFDLADRAYTQALKIAGPKPALLNNRGYSYLIRGDIKRARQDLNTANARDPGNPLIQRNLELLNKAARRG
jgi:Flp pilus assembly protein TadD